MAYERVQKSFGQSSSQKKQSPIVPPLIEEQTQADSLLSPKVKPSRIPSQEEREAIRRKIFDTMHRTAENQAMREGVYSPTVRVQKTPESSSVAGTPIQAKLTIGAPGDKYELEADRVAAQVVNQINAPDSQQSNQNFQQEEMSSENDLMMKLDTIHIQREAKPEEEEELQRSPKIQLQAGDGGMAATAELESSIQQARSGGQPLADHVRLPMEQAFGADFSGVKVHTDAQSDQLNQSIQAKAFTTAQDVFFRQGAYQPGSREGQELLAHELTHVVQQKGGAVQRSPISQVREQHHIQADNSSGKGNLFIQRAGEEREYAHVVIDKNNVGLNTLRSELNKNGLQNAETLKVELSPQTLKTGHQRHVFMWDDTEKGKKGANYILSFGNAMTVKIRNKGFTKGTFFTEGNIKIDSKEGLGKGKETGAWAYEGNIDRKYLFIEGLDHESDPGYSEWLAGNGWPIIDDGKTNAIKEARMLGASKRREESEQ